MLEQEGYMQARLRSELSAGRVSVTCTTGYQKVLEKIALGLSWKTHGHNKAAVGCGLGICGVRGTAV